MLKPHGARKPIATDPPWATRAGKVAWSARTIFPPIPTVTPCAGAVLQGSAKLKMKSLSDNRAMRSTELGASVSWAKRDGFGVVEEQVVGGWRKRRLGGRSWK